MMTERKCVECSAIVGAIMTVAPFIRIFIKR